MKKYKVALVGAGPWAQNYVKTINNFSNIEITHLLRCKNERPHFIQPSCTFIHTQGNEIYFLPDEIIDNVVDGVIVVASKSNISIEDDCYDLGIPCLTEKPFIFDKYLINTVKDYKKIMVNYIHLYSDPFIKLQEIVKNKNIVRIYSYGFGPSPTRKEFNSLWDYAPHDLSQILSIIKEEVTDTLITSHNKTNAGETFRINLTFASGITSSSIVGNGTLIKGRSITVFFEEDDQLKEITYNDMWNHKLRLNNVPIDYNKTNMPLENVLLAFQKLMDGKRDDRFGTELTIQITKILSTYQES